jgi:hypothetical protein
MPENANRIHFGCRSAQSESAAITKLTKEARKPKDLET